MINSCSTILPRKTEQSCSKEDASFVARLCASIDSLPVVDSFKLALIAANRDGVEKSTLIPLVTVGVCLLGSVPLSLGALTLIGVGLQKLVSFGSNFDAVVKEARNNTLNTNELSSAALDLGLEIVSGLSGMGAARILESGAVRTAVKLFGKNAGLIIGESLANGTGFHVVQGIQQAIFDGSKAIDEKLQSAANNIFDLKALARGIFFAGVNKQIGKAIRSGLESRNLEEIEREFIQWTGGNVVGTLATSVPALLQGQLNLNQLGTQIFTDMHSSFVLDAAHAGVSHFGFERADTQKIAEQTKYDPELAKKVLLASTPLLMGMAGEGELPLAIAASAVVTSLRGLELRGESSKIKEILVNFLNKRSVPKITELEGLVDYFEWVVPYGLPLVRAYPLQQIFHTLNQIKLKLGTDYHDTLMGFFESYRGNYDGLREIFDHEGAQPGYKKRGLYSTFHLSEYLNLLKGRRNLHTLLGCKPCFDDPMFTSLMIGSVGHAITIGKTRIFESNFEFHIVQGVFAESSGGLEFRIEMKGDLVAKITVEYGYGAAYITSIQGGGSDKIGMRNAKRAQEEFKEAFGLHPFVWLGRGIIQHIRCFAPWPIQKIFGIDHTLNDSIQLHIQAHDGIPLSPEALTVIYRGTFNKMGLKPVKESLGLYCLEREKIGDRGTPEEWGLGGTYNRLQLIFGAIRKPSSAPNNTPEFPFVFQSPYER